MNNLLAITLTAALSASTMGLTARVASLESQAEDLREMDAALVETIGVEQEAK